MGAPRHGAFVGLALAILALAPGDCLGEIAHRQVPIVAAENFYGDVAGQVGGPDASITSVLSNPDQDPHLFEASPSVARAVAAAQIVVVNGLDYDPWMIRLLTASTRPGRTVIVVSELAGPGLVAHRPGDNPHIWYDPPTMLAFADAMSAALTSTDPDRAATYGQRLAAFHASMRPLLDRLARLRGRLSGAPVTATEPVFGYVFAALGMQVRNPGFQLAVMNNTEPSASDVAAFETDLKAHRVRLLVYNSQASDPIAQRMERLAHASGIPVIGVTETEPAHTTYQSWTMSTLDALDRALPR